MILVTGGTGFIGRVLLHQLVDSGYQVRALIRPSPQSPNLPRGVYIEAAVAGLRDERGLRAAMTGIDTIYHLAGAEWQGPRASLMQTDIQGTRTVLAAAKDAGVSSFIFLSHLGADRASAYPVQKAKAIAEEFVRHSGLNFTIFRSAIAYGPGDGLTSGIAQILSILPFIFMLPGSGSVLLQPLWVEDLATCLVWSLENSEIKNRTIEIGGPEYLSFSQIVEIIMKATGYNRRVVHVWTPFLKGMTVVLESLFPSFPASTFWMDYLAVNRTTALDTMPRVFNLMPSRFTHRMDHLSDVNWRRTMLQNLISRR